MMVCFPSLSTMFPLGQVNSIYSYSVAGGTLYEHILESFHRNHQSIKIVIQDQLLLNSPKDLKKISEYGEVSEVSDELKNPFYLLSTGSELIMRYPWDLLSVQADILSHMKAFIHPTAIIENNVEIAGNIWIGEDVKIYNGAKLKGNIYVGQGSVIGNNALLRGNVNIGEYSVLGFSAEVKNSMLGDDVGVGPMAFVGDSILGSHCFLGGMVRTSNYRLDKKNIQVYVHEKLVDTGLKQFGTIVGENTSFGVGVVIFPGRTVGSNCVIGPGVQVNKNLSAGKKVYLKQQLEII